YLTDLKEDQQNSTYFIETLEANITMNKDVWPELAANTYDNSNIACPAITLYDLQDVDADTKTITISEIDGESVTGLEDLTLKRKTITLSGQADQEVWMLDEELVDYDGQQYEVMYSPAISAEPILLPVRTVIIEALADLALDIDDYWDDENGILTQTRYPGENDLINIMTVKEYLGRYYQRLKEGGFNPAEYETLAQASEMDVVDDFLAGLGYDPLEPENFTNMLTAWSNEVLVNGTFLLDEQEIEFFYLETMDKFRIFKSKRMRFLKEKLHQSLVICNTVAPRILEEAYELIGAAGVGRRIDKMVFSVNPFSPLRLGMRSVSYTDSGVMAYYQITGDDLDENGTVKVLCFNLAAETLDNLLNTPVFIHEIGHTLLEDRADLDKTTLDEYLNAGIADNGYLEGEDGRLHFDYTHYHVIYHESINVSITEVVANWFMLRFMSEEEKQERITQIIANVIEKTANPLMHNLRNLPLICWVVAFARYYNYPETPELLAIEELANEIEQTDATALIIDFMSFLSGLSLKMLNEYYMGRLQTGTATEKEEAVASLRNRLGHDEYEYIRNEAETITDVIVHDYKSTSFTDTDARDAALSALFDPATRPTEINGITVTQTEMVDNSVHFTLTDGTEVVAIPHDLFGSMIIFHVLRKAHIPEADQSVTETEAIRAIRNQTQTEADAILTSLCQ
ncbi:MAG: hypothetical protein KAV87_04090, partial [Desulfobacteraceae bacterium]|nr:hypothetical protein [Desulfobacteraceae bacterium]